METAFFNPHPDSSQPAWAWHLWARRLLALALAAAGAVGLITLPASPAQAQSRATLRDAGKTEFEARCASCHGVNGKGNGPVADLLRKSPPDLTLLARRNGGILPIERLYESISGDTMAAAHGTRDMPIWGRTYREDAANYFMEAPYDPEAYTRARMLLLLEYLSRLQQK